MMDKIHGVSLAASQDRFKGKYSLKSSGGVGLAGFPPLGPVMDDPVGQGPFEADIVAGLLGLDPFMPQNFFPLGLELAIERRVLQQIVHAWGGLCLGGHTL
jgi:hypothetical protein